MLWVYFKCFAGKYLFSNRILEAGKFNQQLRLNTFPIITVAAVGKTILQAKQAAAHSAIENLVSHIELVCTYVSKLFLVRGIKENGLS